ncbi:MAG: YdcF family protein [Terriglobia bacterium]
MLILIACAAAVLCERALYHAIRAQAATDQARTAGAIVVMGAAEYDGTPSPVYEARLDHAFALQQKGLAPLIITTGGSGGDPRFTEAGVGRDYLIQQGAPADRVIAVPRGRTTFQSVRAAASTLFRLHIRRCIAVSDGFHLYRVIVLFRSRGITACGSPVPNSSIESDPTLRTLYSLRELATLSLWYLHVHV